MGAGESSEKGAAAGRTYRLLLVGVTGSGKSSLGNVILGQEKFKAACGWAAGTESCQLEKATRGQIHFEVVDTPGFCDKKRPDEEISQTIAQFLSGVSPGPHAVLVVMKASERYNSDMDRAYTEAKKLLGGEGLASRIILIFTCGDILKEKKVNIESQIKQFFEDSGQMMRDARHRYIVFNNNATGKENEDQLNRLLKLVRSVDADFLSSLTQQKIEEIISNESTKLSKNKNITFEEARYQVRKEMAESAGSNKKVLAAITSVKESVQTHEVNLHIRCTIL